MTIRYRVNRSRALVTVIVEESITPSDLRRFARAVRADPVAYRLRHLVLISERLATPTPEEVLALARSARALPPVSRAKQAIVAFTDLHFGHARIYLAQLDAPERQILLFRELRDALAWLGYGERAGRVELQTLLSLN